MKASPEQPLACPTCAAADTEIIAERQVAHSPSGAKVSYDDQYTKCRSCGTEFYTREQSLSHSRALANASRAAEGLVSPSQIQELRARLGLSQAQLEKTLGVGPKTVVRWEKGTIAPSRAADSLLWIAATYPAVFGKLAERNGVPLTPAQAVSRVHHLARGEVSSNLTIITSSKYSTSMFSDTVFLSAEQEVDSKKFLEATGPVT